MFTDNIKRILLQIGGPISINTTTRYYLLINNSLVKYHENKVNNIIRNKLDFDLEYNISDLFSLYSLIEFITEFLGEDEFSTVTGLDLYQDGYKLLNELKAKILDR